jgi:glucose/arabinose dehydrogenase
MFRAGDRLALALLGAGALVGGLAGGARAQTTGAVRTGAAAFGDWRGDAPGVWRKITPADQPAPFATPSAAAQSQVVDRPAGAQLHVLPGFRVAQIASDLDGVRLMRTAPNGDVFLAMQTGGEVRVMRTRDGADKPVSITRFASGLDGPFGIAFYPPGPNPQWVYVGDTNSVVRFPYRNGDLKARGPAQTVVAKLTASEGGHVTRDLAFSPDGKTLFVSVGSGSNAAEHMAKKSPAEAKAWAASHPLGAAWGEETDRADVLTFTPEGGPPRIYATGIRNCVGLAMNPRTHDLWCSTNERDALGDNLVPDYVTRVKPGGFYGWPWRYMGDREDPRHAGERPDLAGKVSDPDIPIQAHSATLEMTFYPQAASGPAAFPAQYRGDAFSALHGSWNRKLRTGYKVVRYRLHDGVPDGTYEDFLTGFVIDAETVWGRPVGLAIAHDGALLVSEDGNGTIWRISYVGADSGKK